LAERGAPRERCSCRGGGNESRSLNEASTFGGDGHGNLLVLTAAKGERTMKRVGHNRFGASEVDIARTPTMSGTASEPGRACA
jgi:hypothetical protein